MDSQIDGDSEETEEVDLVEILEAANKHYPEDFLDTYYDEDGNFTETGGETIARFLVLELTEVIPGNSYDDSEEKIQKAVNILEDNKEFIEKALRGVKELRNEYG